jgi:hypothetical protein
MHSRTHPEKWLGQVKVATRSKGSEGEEVGGEGEMALENTKW